MVVILFHIGCIIIFRVAILVFDFVVAVDIIVSDDFSLIVSCAEFLSYNRSNWMEGGAPSNRLVSRWHPWNFGMSFFVWIESFNG